MTEPIHPAGTASIVPSPVALHAGARGSLAGALCLNCGTRLVGAHCHACGQSAHVHRTVGAIGHEIAHGVFHVEGKVGRTLPMLVLRPGELTRRYIDGERARFLSPLALFLFMMFLLFATISWVGGEMGAELPPQRSAEQRARAGQELARAQADLAQAERERAGAIPGRHSPASLDTRIAALRATTAALAAAQSTAGSGPDSDPLPDLHTGWHALDHGVEKAKANPGLAIYKLQSSAYKYSWLLVPLSTPVVALLFLWRRRFGLYDHAIFVTYSLAFMLVLVTTLTLASAAGVAGGWTTNAAFAVPPLHMYRQLRGTYALGRWSAAWRMTALICFAFAVLFTFSVLLLLHGLTG